MNDDEPSPDHTPGQIDPWLCHVCDESFRSERGTACACCYQLACREHLDLIVVANPSYGQPELKPVCTRCQERLDDGGDPDGEPAPDGRTKGRPPGNED